MTCKLVKHFMFLWQKPSQHCKAIFLQLKNKVKKVWIKQGNVFKSWGSERLHNLSKVALQSPGLGHFTSSVSMLRVLYFLSEINPVCLLLWVVVCLCSSFFVSVNKSSDSLFTVWPKLFEQDNSRWRSQEVNKPVHKVVHNRGWWWLPISMINWAYFHVSL